jgi:hypothetical protein
MMMSVNNNMKFWAAIMILYYTVVVSITMTTATNHRLSSLSRPQVRGVASSYNRVRAVELLNGSSRQLGVGKENDDDTENDKANKKEKGKGSSGTHAKEPKTSPEEGATEDTGTSEKTKSKHKTDRSDKRDKGDKEDKDDKKDGDKEGKSEKEGVTEGKKLHRLG